MDAIDALINRSSVPKLCDPIPDKEVIDTLFRAAFRAADHAVLKPWRFLTIEGHSRNKLGDLFVEAARRAHPEYTAEKLERVRSKPLRAPLIIVVVSVFQEHPKVPEIEIDLSAGAAAQNIVTAAYAQGVGAIWRTGDMAYDRYVMDGLGLASNEKIIGFLYLGRVDGAMKNLSEPNISDFVKSW